MPPARSAHRPAAALKATLAVLVAGLVTLVLPATASAHTQTAEVGDWPGREVLAWDTTYTLHADGSVDVRAEILWDFGDQPGHGLYFQFPTVQGIDDSTERVWEITDVTADSPSGAPDDLHLDHQGDDLVVRIGNENIGDVSGIHTYVLTYTVGHVMNETTADETTTGQAGDEFYWNVIGPGWSTPIRDITVTVEAEVPALDARCFAGNVAAGVECAVSTTDGYAIQFAVDALEPFEPMTVVTLYEAGSFDTTAITQPTNEFDRAFARSPITVGGALAILGVGIWLIIRHFRRTAVDRQYVDLTPGLAPLSADEAATRPVDRNTPIAVQFEPPLGLRPGQLGTLLDNKADVRDVTATIVDQAVRGYMRIDPIGDEHDPDDYVLVKLRDADGAMPAYGRTLFEALFDGRNKIRLSQLKTTFAADSSKVQAEMYRDVTERGWYQKNPSTARSSWAGTGVALLVAGVLGTVWLANVSDLGLLGVPFVVLGVVMLVLTGAAPARTAEGTRVLAQTRGFKMFLETADANQLRFEEGHDIFSQYLPFAIAFGVADKWAALFEKMAREGYSLPSPSWYGLHYGGAFWLSHQGFGRQLDDFTVLADSAISAPTPGSSGGSGFSSGGGFSGGGSFGGGGGGW